MEYILASIRENLLRVRETIDETLNRVGRKDSVYVVAVSKTVLVENIKTAIEEGVDNIGENRVQEAMLKHAQIGANVTWHMVGHLQRNKVKQATQIFQMVQSIDKVETVVEIEKRAKGPLDVLIEINSSGETTKSGIHPDRLFSLVDDLINFNKIRIKGLMTIGPFTDNKEEIRSAFILTRKCFEELKDKYKNLDISILSMGMTADYPIAIEEGSNMVRLGTAIFGGRRY
jgi:pyridoxal phosphate enzyme (YggS family)